MDMQNQKCVMVMDEDLPLGVIANTAGIMGITLGKHMPETVGPDVRDKSGREHLGIIEFPVPILKADKEKIRSIREQLYRPRAAEPTMNSLTRLPRPRKRNSSILASESAVPKNWSTN